MKTSLPLQRALFSLPARSIYLNCAYMSPLMRSVEKAGVAGIARKRNPITISPEDFFTESNLLRAEFARLVGVNRPQQIAIIPSVSYGMATIASNVRLSRSDKVIVAGEQFPSNYYSWQRLCQHTGAQLQAVAAPAAREQRAQRWNERILEAIDQKTRIVALGHVHWADGTLFQLADIRKRTREVGALLIIDGTQSVGALPFDVQKFQPDALVCAGYKWLMGPYSTALAYYGPAFENGNPLEENWINRLHSENFAQLVNYQSQYQPGALRYDAGERSNFVLVPMLLAALRQLNQWTPEKIQDYAQRISARAIAQLLEAGHWVEDETGRGHHLFGIRLRNGMALDAVRPKIARANIAVSFRGDCMRVSPHVYNRSSDLLKLASLLQH
jgi:selenocysteine lyase/cysteine desulfurase